MFGPKTYCVVIVGAQWGDEGKGKIVDVLAEEADLVVRYQGGANAGHTVVTGDDEFILHQIPSGILHQQTMCVIGNGVVLDPETFFTELDKLVARKLAARARKDELLQYLASAVIAIQRPIYPQILLLDSQSAQLRRAVNNAELAGEQNRQAAADLAAVVVSLLPLEKIMLESTNISDKLAQVAAETNAADLKLLMFPLRRSLDRLQGLAQSVSQRYPEQFQDSVARLLGFAIGSESIPEARQRELDIIADGQRLLVQNRQLSGQPKRDEHDDEISDNKEPDVEPRRWVLRP